MQGKDSISSRLIRLEAGRDFFFLRWLAVHSMCVLWVLWSEMRQKHDVAGTTAAVDRPVCEKVGTNAKQQLFNRG